MREIGFLTEMVVPIHFKKIIVETELRCDLFIENCLVVELKSVATLLPINEAQILTYI